MISLDLQVPIHPESRLYLRFTMGGVSYQFRVLCFGLTTAPQVFTRLMAPISGILHRYGIRMLRYLDDWLILAESRTACLQARDRLLQVCEELGLQVNFKKSSLIPSQDRTYLGMQIQSVRFVAKPTETRVENLLEIIEEFLSSPAPLEALWRSLLGHLSSLTLLVKGGMLGCGLSRFASGPGGTSETNCFASLGILCVRRIFYGGLGRFKYERA